MHFARRRKGVTNYRKRLALLKSGLPRAVVRFTNSKVMIQITNFEGKGDRVLAAASSSDLEKMGWKPLADGHEMRMDANQQGFDIQAINPENDKLWRVECKGRIAKWGNSNVEISERQMHHALF